MASVPAAANPDDDAMFRAHGEALADAIDHVLEGWVVACVDRILRAWQDGAPPSADVMARAAAAGRAARAEVVPELRALLALDLDEQRANPLALVRRAVRFPTAVLREAGVAPVVRDEFAERSFPDDDYGLTPASFADVDPSLHEPGLVWGAAKAHVHLVRRRAEGKR
jgi:hypothetical protein